MGPASAGADLIQTVRTFNGRHPRRFAQSRHQVARLSSSSRPALTLRSRFAMSSRAGAERVSPRRWAWQPDNWSGRFLRASVWSRCCSRQRRCFTHCAFLAPRIWCTWAFSRCGRPSRQQPGFLFAVADLQAARRSCNGRSGRASSTILPIPRWPSSSPVCCPSSHSRVTECSPNSPYWARCSRHSH